ncbi:hypothetical protein [Streptomyces sp. NPDC001601]
MTRCRSAVRSCTRRRSWSSSLDGFLAGTGLDLDLDLDPPPSP